MPGTTVNSFINERKENHAFFMDLRFHSSIYLLMTDLSRKDLVWLPIYLYFCLSNFTPFLRLGSDWSWYLSDLFLSLSRSLFEFVVAKNIPKIGG